MGGAVPEAAIVAESTTPWVFDNRAIRQGGTRNEPLFVFRDVCEVLGITKPRDAYAKLPEYCRTRPLRVDGLEGDRMVVREMSTINEAGLWRMLLRSDKPAAEPFIRWVTCEVLPSIRRTGKYAATARTGGGGMRGRPCLSGPLDVALFEKPVSWSEAFRASGQGRSGFGWKLRHLRDKGVIKKTPEGLWVAVGKEPAAQPELTLVAGGAS